MINPYTTSGHLSTYLRLVLVILGIIGNTLTIALMFRQRFKTSLGLYMLTVATADLGVMIFGQGEHRYLINITMLL